ncbi:agrin-like isoform X2 [Neocloeon triangulifer]|uniref:agrin-like isoform X2 n=1 Tax=Neocloeon triangulifer TaxID=2078957 RepID=UPI00286F365E|nr:agrin-like isoform X2 [Neocloeon triangulifer]
MHGKGYLEEPLRVPAGAPYEWYTTTTPAAPHVTQNHVPPRRLASAETPPSKNGCFCCEGLLGPSGAPAPHAGDAEDGFGGVVTSMTGGAVGRRRAYEEDAPAGGGCCCVSEGSAAPDQDPGCCRPAALLLLLVALLTLFLLVSGAILYTNYLNLKPRPHLHQGESCADNFCAFGATCVEDEDGEARCRCPEHCPTLGQHPVCGSDGRSYVSECVLRMTACQRQEHLRVMHLGECDMPDPCAQKQCPPGARCVASADGRSARCECPAKCPAYGDHVGSRPVCGSDGVDYANLCQLRRAACTADADITVRYHGKCDPCAGLLCPSPEECQLDEDRNPVCRCGETCPLEFMPVCGSDGKTYVNECSLRQQACRTQKNLRIIYRGECSSGVNPCAGIRCSPGQECVINKFGIAKCECPAECEPVLRPTCGDDGRTYDSVCQLKRAACLAKRRVAVAHAGACGSAGPCSRHVCSLGAQCVEKGDGLPYCECPTCPAEFSPACGSDGLSYDNECKLRLEACLRKKEITLLYDGLCNGCESKQCDFYAVCESDGSGSSKCVCPQICPADVLSAVCGSDGRTYRSECELRIHACKTQKMLLVAHKGDCDACLEVKCKFGAVCEAGECVCPGACPASKTESICASDGITYASECEMVRAGCAASQELQVEFYGECTEKLVTPAPTVAPMNTFAPMVVVRKGGKGPGARANEVAGGKGAEAEACKDIRCDFDATCELGDDHFPRCTCKFECPVAENKPVCASDLRMYPNACAMKMEGCQRQEELRLRPIDLCEGMEVKPCNGATPLVSPETGDEYDCGSGPRRQDCPSASYCHQTPNFAKCCRKDAIVAQKNCEDSWFGCCPDGKTPALGADNVGCPSTCNCNKLGSYSEDQCDEETGQCDCRPGVGGEKCDRCEPGYWGLLKLSEGYLGCIPCQCSSLGSVRDDCEQMTGRCVCKPGVTGQRCTNCAPGLVLGLNGCARVDPSAPRPTSCSELVCYHGATCEMKAGKAECSCRIACSEDPPTRSQTVCGNDGQTYSTECQMKQYACRYQKEIAVQGLGSCRELGITEAPLRRWTGELSSPLYKSTRHLLPLEHYDGGSAWAKGGGHRPTPATVQVRSLLGDVCSRDLDCVVVHSRCSSNICICKEGHVESSDHLECISNNSRYKRGCSSQPCHNGGTCYDLDEGVFECKCQTNWTGIQCQQVAVKKEYDIPAFDGHSFVQLKRLKAYNKFSIEIEFKTYANDGILLYNQQKTDGTGDFISLAIVNGHVEFRYNLGNGPVVITSHEKVQLKKFHHVVARRYHRDGVLKLDDFEDVAGQSQGSLKSLDLQEDAFIGFVPTQEKKVFENIGTSFGLIGCVRKLKIGRKVVELHAGRDALVEKTQGIRECGENPCSVLPCLNGGTCLAIDSVSFKCACTASFSGDTCALQVAPCASSPCAAGSSCVELVTGFTCQCPIGKKGRTCHEVELNLPEVYTAEFQGDSFLALPKLENVARAFSFEVWFMSRAPSGLLLYDGQLVGGRGDFISLNLVDRHVQFKFDLGSGSANITSPTSVTLNEWHMIRVSRVDKEGTLQVDNDTIVKGSSGPPLNELNLELPFYIGGVPALSEVSRDSGVTIGLNGAIQRVVVNGEVLDDLVKRANSKRGVSHYSGPPCSGNASPCKNGGVCHPRLNSFLCKCAPSYTGDQCQQRIGDDGLERPVKFTGETFLQYSNKAIHKQVASNKTLLVANASEEVDVVEEEIYEDDDEEGIEINEDDEYVYDDDDFDFFDKRRKGERNNRYELKVRTQEDNGLLLWTNRGNTLKDDFLAIAVINGYPEISFNLGRQKNLLAIRSRVKISDGVWHSITVQRRKRQAQISVDGSTPIKGVAEQGASLLNTNGRLWIGGAPTLPPGLPAQYYLGFRGCVTSVKVDKRPLHLVHHAENSPATHFCDAN